MLQLQTTTSLPHIRYSHLSTDQMMSRNDLPYKQYTVICWWLLMPMTRNQQHMRCTRLSYSALTTHGTSLLRMRYRRCCLMHPLQTTTTLHHSLHIRPSTDQMTSRTDQQHKRYIAICWWRLMPMTRTLHHMRCTR